LRVTNRLSLETFLFHVAISGGWVVLKIPVVTSGFAMNVPVFEHPLPLPPKKNEKMDIKLHYPISFN